MASPTTVVFMAPNLVTGGLNPWAASDREAHEAKEWKAPKKAPAGAFKFQPSGLVECGLNPFNQPLEESSRCPQTAPCKSKRCKEVCSVFGKDENTRTFCKGCRVVHALRFTPEKIPEALSVQQLKIMSYTPKKSKPCKGHGNGCGGRVNAKAHNHTVHCRDCRQQFGNRFAKEIILEE